MAMVDVTRPTRSAALLLLAALAWPVYWPSSADAETAMRFTLDRKIDGPAAPFFLAIEKGYFQAEGLNVSIDAADGSLESMNRLATGGYDMGVADINGLIKLRDANPDTPVKAVFVIFDKPPPHRSSPTRPHAAATLLLRQLPCHINERVERDCTA